MCCVLLSGSRIVMRLAGSKIIAKKLMTGIMRDYWQKDYLMKISH